MTPMIRQLNALLPASTVASPPVEDSASTSLRLSAGRSGCVSMSNAVGSKGSLASAKTALACGSMT